MQKIAYIFLSSKQEDNLESLLEVVQICSVMQHKLEENFYCENMSVNF